MALRRLRIVWISLGGIALFAGAFLVLFPVYAQVRGKPLADRQALTRRASFYFEQSVKHANAITSGSPDQVASARSFFLNAPVQFMYAEGVARKFNSIGDLATAIAIQKRIVSKSANPIHHKEAQIYLAELERKAKQPSVH